MGKMKLHTLIMGKMKVRTFVMGTMRVRIKLFYVYIVIILNVFKQSKKLRHLFKCFTYVWCTHMFKASEIAG